MEKIEKKELDENMETMFSQILIFTDRVTFAIAKCRDDDNLYHSDKILVCLNKPPDENKDLTLAEKYNKLCLMFQPNKEEIVNELLKEYLQKKSKMIKGELEEKRENSQEMKDAFDKKRSKEKKYRENMIRKEEHFKNKS